uniref:Sperm tail PG-rich repeat containing 1 n=1 Tax=Leptobrachium leishanense TaxID=445787 RepID=A0A8C5PDK1_9ANUR
MMEACTRNASYQEMNYRRLQNFRSIRQNKKGFTVPTTSASIPTKYQIMFIPKSESKGFNSRVPRFSFDFDQNENPGPGSYNYDHESTDIDNVSFSKKGTGGFPSKASRTTFLKATRTPAPNTYKIQSALFSKKDFNKSNSSMFQQPIAIKVEDKKNKTPAPNRYNASVTLSHPNNNVSAHAAFVSKTKRELGNLNHLKGPSPCHYRVNDSLTKEAPTILVSCFKSKTSRDMLNITTNNLGPASYDPYGAPDVINKNNFLRKHYLCISAPAIPVPKSPPIPGPGQYEIVDYAGPPKHHFSNAVFLSNTSRWTGDISGEGLPGPGFSPLSHRFNSSLILILIAKLLIILIQLSIYHYSTTQLFTYSPNQSTAT